MPALKHARLTAAPPKDDLNGIRYDGAPGWCWRWPSPRLPLPDPPSAPQTTGRCPPQAQPQT
eukprot:scaffold308959_cov17-Tisochrysis_lutea.AAC.1